MQTYQTKVMSRLEYVVTGVAHNIETTGRAVKLRNVKVKVAGYVGAGVGTMPRHNGVLAGQPAQW